MSSSVTQGASGSNPPFDDELIVRLLDWRENQYFDAKRAGDNHRKLVTISAFANSEGGLLAIGIEDSSRANGRNRVFGIQEKPESIDDLRRMLRTRITPPLEPPHCEPPTFLEVGCTLRDGTRGSVMLIRVPKSASVHSLVDGGTYVRFERSNRHLTAAEITDLSMQRGATSAVNGLVEVPFDLLDTDVWRTYREQRRLTRPIDEAMLHLGLARRDTQGVIRPTRAAVLLFAEEPSGLLDAKCTCRLFHYRGDRVEHGTSTNLLRPPRTLGGPLIRQIRDAAEATIEALARGIQMGPLGFEVAQKYPVRVIREAITNAIIHRDYRLSVDIHIRIFAGRIEIESPGLLPGEVTTENIGVIGSRPRNRSLVDHLREFPTPPNLDAGEGVRMMKATMNEAGLYPPLFITRPDLEREAVLVMLFNESRPSAWDQVQHYLERHGEIGNAEVRKILGTDNPVRASRQLKSWVERGLLVVANPDAAKQHRRYRRPGAVPVQSLFISNLRKQGE